MDAVPQKVLNWLHGALSSEYRNVNRTYSDVAQTLAYNPNFSLRTNVYTYENGGSSLLLNLQGTLPVPFRGTTYAFPISIWIPQEYPNSAPVGFVTPTKDMAVRPGQYVSGEGRIYHPYLAGWKDDVSRLNVHLMEFIGRVSLNFSKRSNLSEFFLILQKIFSQEPPVIARQEPNVLQRPSSRQFVTPPPVPPLPPELERSEQEARQFQSSVGHQPPPPPPKPFDSRGQAPLRSSGPPPLPPLPTSTSSHYGAIQLGQQDGYHKTPQPMAWKWPQRAGSSEKDKPDFNTGSGSSQYSNKLSWQEGVGRIPPTSLHRTLPKDQRNADQSSYPQHGPPSTSLRQTSQTTPPMYQDGYQQPPYLPNYQQPPPQAYQLRSHPQQQQPRPKAPEDLLTAPFETALSTQPTNIAPPPVPPNPQKDALLATLSRTLTQQIHSTHTSNLSAIPPLRAQQGVLSATLNAINTEIAQLKDLENMLSSNEKILHQAMRDADKVLEDAKRRKVPDVDEVLVAPTIVAGQLYQIVAEEKATEESRGVLAKALDKGRISGAVWAKQTRTLAREEFLKKALIKKISRGIGLIEDERWV